MGTSMNPYDGTLYDSVADGIKAGEKPENLVEIHGTREQVEHLSRAVRREHQRAIARAERKARLAAQGLRDAQ
jgi:hypothetical protein